MVHRILSMEIFTIKHYITEVEKQNRFYEKNCTKSLDIYDRRMYIDNFQFADLKQNTVPYIAVMHFGAWLLFFCERRKITLMFEKKEALYLVDHESYLHLKETVTQTGFAYETFDKATGAAQHTGLITYEEMLENPIRNPLACARVMALQEIGLKGEVVSEVALRTLEQIKEARRAYRKEHSEDAHDHSIRFITSDYNDLFRIPDGGKVQIDYAGRHFVSPCVYIDDYHTRIAGRVYHICEFAEMMERGGTVAPEPEITANQAAWQIGHREYLSIQSTESGWDYSVYDRQFSEIDGGDIDLKHITIQQCRDMLLQDLGWQDRSFVPMDYEMVEERAADVAEEKLRPLLRGW